MYKYLIAIFFMLILYSSAVSNGTSGTAVSFGPMFHWNICDKKYAFSWGFEASYWTYDYTIPLSIDVGFDIDKNGKRIYSELQSGIFIAGGAIGPVLEFKNNTNNLGMQWSVWGNFFGGINLRNRYTNNEKYFCPGIYAKLPIPVTGSWLP